MRRDAGVGAAALLICAALLLQPARPSLAHRHSGAGGVSAPVLVAKEGRRSQDRSKDRYENLPPEEKARLKKNLRQWQSLSPEEQQRMRRKMDRLNQMPPDSQKLYQKRFQQWQRLSPQEQEQIRRKLQRWDTLSPEEQQSIQRRFK